MDHDDLEQFPAPKAGAPEVRSALDQSGSYLTCHHQTERVAKAKVSNSERSCAVHPCCMEGLANGSCIQELSKLM